MPIVIPDLSGLSQGISTAGGALAGALQQRAENRLASQKEARKREDQRVGMELVSDWANNYDQSKSPMENVGALQSALAASNIDPTAYQSLLQDVMKKSISQQGDQYGANQIFGRSANTLNQGDASSQAIGESPILTQDKNLSMEAPKKDRMESFSNADLVNLSSNPNRIISETAKAEIEKRKIDQKISAEDRKYHTQFAAKQEEKIASLRDAVPKKRSALRHSRLAVESGQVGSFSINQIADSIGGAAGDALRNSKGTQLITAGKENLLSNMARVSAKGQNQWFEERLASMFPKVGQSMEANLATQEMLEGELVLEEAYLKKFDELAAADEELYGYSKKDVDRRARQAVEHLESAVFDRSVYRMRELEEKEMGKTGMQKAMNKKVPKGTPMTLAMGALFLDKYKDSKVALDVAKKLGYKVPNGEDLQLYLMTSEEFAEKVGKM
jgi:hypothetical protein